ncbi:hypothetical protein FOB58_004131 [Candida parapsilosis]|uniref:Complex I-B15 n=2 Tax=Candida parapsilosis TaxID=5480 RepID=G8BJW5_CANPC|nr:uncharacterized protein CPAR2_407330 [Candida parapsilosis]KAF6045694.1 hypothetical protein FOB58_004131 [Candida parapsilosis]KAF6046753.1 hypothetical protein FOB59_004218 [Candida parapsilosis]KAF6050806.1 hypothetical protein FOB60_003474 [Candida parapsilosis]KAF6062472.1 hypothetical protein FOB61_003902 [Candida parapsilosis]KAI5910771.1 hypothetical protein K4G61_g4472 [Candida parapsilosis]
MAGTLHPDRELQRFNTAKEKLGHYFRFKPKSAAFNIVFMGLVPIGLTLWAYNYEGAISITDRLRKKPVLTTDYVPRDKDL